MEIRLLEKKPDRISFILRKATPSFANTLRRVITNRVPVLAVETVEFRKNSSSMYDEQVAHRLGLVPLKTDLKSYRVKSECKCEGKGCAQCELKLTLKAKGPGIVYASELKSQDPQVKPVYPKIPIVKLLKGQDLELIATAELGEARVHAKWSAGLAHYRFKPEITVTKAGEGCEACASVCPVNVFEFKGKLKTIQDNLLKCHLCNACVEESNSGVLVSYDRETFVFFVESWGQLDCAEMVTEGIATMNRILDGFAKAVEAL